MGVVNVCDFGFGWKIFFSVDVKVGEIFEFVNIVGVVKIMYIWIMMYIDNWCIFLLCVYWDGLDEFVVEVLYGDFFCNGWGVFVQVNLQMIVVNLYGGFNFYWLMLFCDGVCLIFENILIVDVCVYYQIIYEIGGDYLNDVYFYVQWWWLNLFEEFILYVILEGIEGQGQYVGIYIVWGVNFNGWWGEGEIKFYFDDDIDYLMICGIGMEDYFGGVWNFDIFGQGYIQFLMFYFGMLQVIRFDGFYVLQQWFGMYWWYFFDLIYFVIGILRVDI